MKKTKFESFCNGYVCRGCRYCVKGEKLVLFVGGRCSRNCWYCSLSKNRKNSDIAYANERPIDSISDLILEAKLSNSKGAGITGGDPMVYFDDVVKYSSILKKEFGQDFHIHIYLPLPLVDEDKLKILSETIDEVRFHLSFVEKNDEDLNIEEIEKIKLASRIFGKRNTGIELPCLPEKKEKILEFILRLKEYIGFCNLNEFEISETNFERVTKEYGLNEDTYTVSGSVDAGKWIIKECEKKKISLSVHLCTAKTKDNYQFINRLLKHDILPFGHRTNEGTVIYFAHYFDDLASSESKIKKVTKKYYVDKEKQRIIIEMKYVKKVFLKTKLKIARVEEHPTYGADYLEFGYIDE